MSDLEARVAELRRTVGIAVPVEGWNRRVTVESVKHFLAGIGDDHPLWISNSPVPPSYLYSCSSIGRASDSPAPAPSTLLPGYAALWKGDSWRFFAELECEQIVNATVQLSTVDTRLSRTRGTVVDLEELYEYRSDDGALIAECRKRTMRFLRATESNSDAVDKPPVYDAPSYTHDELDWLMRESLDESGSGSRPAVTHEVGVGDPLGALIKGPLTVTSIIAWLLGWGSPLALTDRLAHRMWSADPATRLFGEHGYPDTAEASHWDTVLAKQAGFPRGYDFGAQRISWLIQLVTQWCADRATVVEVDARLLAPNLIGDVTRITGEVAAIHTDGRIECIVQATNQNGELSATASALVRLRD